MRIFLAAIFLFTSLFLCLVFLVDGSNTIIEKQMEVLVLQKEKEKLQTLAVELEYLNALKTNEKELLKQLKSNPKLEFRSP